MKRFAAFLFRTLKRVLWDMLLLGITVFLWDRIADLVDDWRM